MLTDKKVLISGASFAGLSTAYWMIQLGYKVTIVEMNNGLKHGGTAVDIKDHTVDVVKRMGLYEHVKASRLNPKISEFKNAEDVTLGSLRLGEEGEAGPDNEFEIERDVLLELMFGLLKSDVELVFDTSITVMHDAGGAVAVTFADGSQRKFAMVFGCDGIHSAVRNLWFGQESQYTHFLEHYASVSIVSKLLTKRDTLQIFNVPGKTVILGSYKNSTDIILMFASQIEIAYDHRDERQQKRIIQEQFSGLGWRTAELLQEVTTAKSFYFDKMCQIRMPSWTKGRVALVGDAGYCASPAAGMGGSLAIDGAAALGDSFAKHGADFEAAFRLYNQSFRPFVEQIQANVVKDSLEMLVPKTDEAISERNRQLKGL